MSDTIDAYERRGDFTINVAGDLIMTAGDENIVAREGSQVATGGSIAAGRDASGNRAAGGADAGEGGTAATGGASVAQQGSAAASGGSQASVGLVERAKKSGWFKVWAAISLLLAVATTVLLVIHVFDFEWAGYILAVLGVVVGVLPLLGGG